MKTESQAGCPPPNFLRELWDTISKAGWIWPDYRFIREMQDSVSGASGSTLWRVTGTWAENGATGRIDRVVVARTATDAIALAWEVEDDGDLRTIQAEWLCPFNCVKKGQPDE